MDVVPILYDGDPDWYGKLVNQEDGSFLWTCIPRHLEFIGKRKTAQQTDFAQVVRLAKYWAGEIKRETTRLPIQVIHDRNDPVSPVRRWNGFFRLS